MRGGEEISMDTTSVMAQLEAAVAGQAALGGADTATEQAAELLLAALEPALRQSVLSLAEQAAVEVGAQLPNHRVDVVLVEGDPSLRVAAAEAEVPVTDAEYEARITLRLPDSLKKLIEESAGDAGDSVNSWVVKALSSSAGGKRRVSGRRVQGVIET
jgi:hypothetical protein